MDPLVTSIQPGGGYCMRLELAWGRLRRWYLRTFRPGYVARMRELRHGQTNRCPFEPLDQRDTKFYRNQGGYHWRREDDRFRWRDRLPVTRDGLAEVLIFCGGLLLATGVAALVFWPVACVLGLLALLPLWFFRDPKREVPAGQGLVRAPADGRVVYVEQIDYDDFIGGPAVKIGIFLSIFNVHINRVPMAARVVGIGYHPGKFLNALKPSSATENEQMTVRLEEDAPPYRRMIVRQIAGAIARRIVCWVRPGDALGGGSQFGMIKFGSRTELLLAADPDLVIETRPGRKVKAGISILARYGEKEVSGESLSQ